MNIPYSIFIHVGEKYTELPIKEVEVRMIQVKYNNII